MASEKQSGGAKQDTQSRGSSSKSQGRSSEDKESTKVSAQGSVKVSSSDRESSSRSGADRSDNKSGQKTPSRASDQKSSTKSGSAQKSSSKSEPDRKSSQEQSRASSTRSQNNEKSSQSRTSSSSGSSKGGQERSGSTSKGTEVRAQGSIQAQSKGGGQERSQKSAQGSQKGGQSSAQGRYKTDDTFDAQAAIATLNNLLIVDYDALGLYDRVLQGIDNEQFRKTIEQFRGDHQRHIDELTVAIRNLEGEPASRPSIMGPIAKVMASVASTLMGNKGALQALWQGEQYTTTSYDGAGIAGFPEELRDMVSRNAADEHRHLQWVQETLNKM